MNSEFNSNPLSLVVFWLVPILSCIIGLHFTVIGVMGYNLANIPGDLGDARFNMYILEHGYQYITIQVKELWDVQFMYPAHNILAYSDNLLGSMPLYALFRLLHIDRETSFQLWIIVVSILNFISAFYVFGKLTNQSILATAGAYIFAFSLFLFCQFNHPQVFPRFISPLVIYWVLRYSDGFNLKYALYPMLGLVYQFYCGMYLGFLLTFISAVLFLVLLAVNFRKAISEGFFKLPYLLKLISIVALSVLIIAPLAIPYYKLSQILGPRDYAGIFPTLPFLQSYFFSTNISVTWGFLSKHLIIDNIPWWDHPLFIGLIPWAAFVGTILFIITRFFKSDKTSFQVTPSQYLVPIIVTIILCIVLTLRIGHFTLYKWVYQIPGFSSLGTLLRIMNVLLFLFCLLVCLLANEVVKKNKTLIFSLLLIGVFTDNFSRPKEYIHFGKVASQNRLKNIVTQLNQVDWRTKKAFAYMPPHKENEAESAIQIDGMLASQLVHKPCVNGYSSTSPQNYSDFWRDYNEKALYFWLDANGIDHSKVAQIK